jgi:hypothetical protein
MAHPRYLLKEKGHASSLYLRFKKQTKHLWEAKGFRWQNCPSLCTNPSCPYHQHGLDLAPNHTQHPRPHAQPRRIKGREGTACGTDSAWSSFPVGNSELPPAAVAGKGRLSHLRWGLGGALHSAHCSHTQNPLLALLPTAHSTGPTWTWDKEVKKRRAPSHSPHPTRE